MNSIFVIYLTSNQETIFSKSYASFSQAKEDIDAFLKDFSDKQGKKLAYLSKAELEALKVPEDIIYARKKTSQATLYHRITNPGRIYNTYTLEKLGKLEITEFHLSQEPEVEEVKKQETVENMSHGTHGNLLVELREKISNLRLRHVRSAQKEEAKVINQSDFIDSLLSRKEKLNHVEVPERPLIL